MSARIVAIAVLAASAACSEPAVGGGGDGSTGSSIGGSNQLETTTGGDATGTLPPGTTSGAGDSETTTADGSSSGGSVAVCGNGVVEDGEDCDDANRTDDDGCDADCLQSRVVEVAAGDDTTCVRRRTGSVKCWGGNLAGALGYGHTMPIGDDEPPAAAPEVDLGGSAIALELGPHSCAVLPEGRLRCWGYNKYGQLGYGHTLSIGDDELPAMAGDVDVGGKVVAVSAASGRTCAILEGGGLKCWGFGGIGLGYGLPFLENVGDDETPAAFPVYDLGVPAAQVVGEPYNVCARLTSGAVRCWGEGAEGELGNGDGSSVSDPSAAGDVPLGGPAIRIASGRGHHRCAVLDSHDVLCWGEAQASGALGYPFLGIVGDNETPESVGPVDVGEAVVDVTVGWHHTCALTVRGTVRCWGAGPATGRPGQIGDDETPASVGDVDVGGVVVQVVAGDSHTCALLEDGHVRCWGYSPGGALGYPFVTAVGDDETPAEMGDVQVF